ncbi:MAG: phenylalanine--tRNA ligase subunit beta [Gemmatimonadaceae bacterium]
MNASYEWLRTFVPVDMSPEEVRDVFTSRCTPVDDLVSLRQDLRDVVVGRVVEANRHPNADHLWVTKVDAGTGELIDVVCGASNVRAGKMYPFAPSGSVLPGGTRLEKRKIRGAVSDGMLCSARELNLGQNHEGILELDTNSEPGTPFLTAVRVGDTRFVIDVNPNRPDLLSHLGLARELSAATGVPWSLPKIPGLVEASEVAIASTPSGANRAGQVQVKLEDSEGCPRYMGVVIRGLRVGPSPDWLAERLTAVGGGSRAINNVVDVTNYLLHELGQPMHAFDVAKLKGPAIIVRKARDGEMLITLDGAAQKLESWMTVIADADRPQAVAGVMGGRESEVSDQTTDIFLEVATFSPLNTRRTRRALGMSTDASYRFERGTDIEGPPAALDRAIRLILAVAGGKVDDGVADLYPFPRAPRVVPVRVTRVARLLGETVPADEITSLLRSIGFGVTGSAGEAASADAIDVVVPSWRPDISLEVDLIEEIARLHGYDNISSELRPFRLGTVPDAPLVAVTRRVREMLVSSGLLEVRPMPFVTGSESDDGFVRVLNPISESEAFLRRDLLDSLSRRAEYNLSRMQHSVRLFELGAVFARSPEGTPVREEFRVGALIMGERRPRHFTDERPPLVDEWDAKFLAEELARTARIASCDERPVALRRGEGDLLWEIAADDVQLGVVRRLALDAPVWAASAFGVELRLAVVDSTAPARAAAGSANAAAAGSLRYNALPSTPAAEFDLALLVPNEMTVARVEETIMSSAGELLEDLTLFDEYKGPGVPAGLRSVAWRLTFRHPERTLRDKEIAARREKLLRTLEGELGVRQRTT